MNKKTIAIAALALLATSGLASARPLHSTQRVQTDQQNDQSYSATVSSPYNAMNRYDETTGVYVQGGEPTQGAENQVFDHPGDNDMDRYHTEDQ
jgi:hypothetical protein